MSLSPNSRVHHCVDVTYDKCKRSSSLKWIAANCTLLAVLACDLWNKCPGYASATHYAELAAAVVLLANALRHARRLAARAGPPPAAPRPPARAAPPEPPPHAPLGRPAAPDSPPAAAPAPAAPAGLERDEFIASRRGLAEYIGAYERRSRGAARAEPRAACGPRPAYRVSAPERAADGAPSDEGEPRSPRPRLRLDPRHLERRNYNLRLWLHATLLAPLARELERAEAESGPAASALRPYLQPFADRRYVARRIGELARGGCLSAYRWSGGGADWDAGKPTDAELLLRLLGAYLDAQLAPGRGFSGRHLSAAPAPPPRGPDALAVHQTAARPPHFVLVLADDTLEAARGRNNLLHTLLLLLADAARRRPAALCGLPLGPAGLNALWILDR